MKFCAHKYVHRFGVKRISLLRKAGLLIAVAVFAAGALPDEAGAQKADRRIVTIEEADFFGSDYRTVKDVDLEQCKSACLSDNQCQAFTYNTSAGWCFLKSDLGQLQAFEGAVAGRVVTVAAKRETQEADRRTELSFVDRGTIEKAVTYAARIASNTAIPALTVQELRARGRAALNAGDGAVAQSNFISLVAIDSSDFRSWADLARSQLLQKPERWEARTRKQEEAISSSLNAYLRSVDANERAHGLDLIAQAFENRAEWKVAIKALRASLVLDDNLELRSRYERIVAEHGFRILEPTVAADAQTPRICVVFSSPLQRGPDFTPFLDVKGRGAVAIETDGAQLCADGVLHGERYDVTVRSGLPAADGEKLEKSVRLTVYVRDRAPSVHFPGRAYVLPSGGEPTLPIVSVNTEEVDAAVYRIGDRALAETVRRGTFLRQMSSYNADQLSEELGSSVWSGIIDTQNRLNEDVTTAVPLNDLGLEIKPGVYVMTARSKLDIANAWGPLATQWFIVSDLGLSSLTGSDGITVNVRSLTSAKAVAGAKIQLLAVNNEILAEAASDVDGLVRFAPGFARGKGGMAPGLLVARTDTGDYSFLDLRKPAFDLSDRGVEGRAAPGPLDVFAWMDRGIYKAGETAHAQALVRTRNAKAQSGLPLTFILERPDGVEHSRHIVSDAGLGGYLQDFVLEGSVQQGVWTWKVHIDPEGDALARASFLVEDYQPERVDFELNTAAEAFDRNRPISVSLEGRMLYGSPASGQKLEGEITISPSRTLQDWPGYQFGLLDETAYPVRESLPAGLKTDAEGQLDFKVSLPEIATTTGLFTGRLTARLVEPGGRFVERRLDMPVSIEAVKIGIKPLFQEGVDEGGPAAFDVVVLGQDGNPAAREGLNWTVSKINRRYQWYRHDGSWNYEPVTTSERVASGSMNVTADAPAHLSVPVEWGQYRLDIQSQEDGAVISSVAFSAGWYTAETTSETPDYLDIGLDKKAYRAGEIARVRLTSQTDGTAVVHVVSGGILRSQTLEVAGGSAALEIPVEENWGAGAYITASLYRPMQLLESRMPSRSVGLTWAKVDPQDRVLDVQLEAPELIRPSTRLTVPVEITGLGAGAQAFVTVAAVDVGILNLTGYEPPAPETWYFGQRRLGTEIRDLYGQLIDRTIGVKGKVRTGGDAMAARLDAPPPDEEPVALFSGIVTLDGEGKATVNFEVPDFNGTLRLMAVAWTQTGVGHAHRDVKVRAPLVLSASLPAYLAPGDASRLRLDIDNVGGPAGSYELTLTADGTLDLEGAGGNARSIALAAGEKVSVLVPIKAGDGLGKSEIFAALMTPDGEEFVKRMVLDIRDTSPETERRSSFALAAGNRLSLDSAAYDGLRPETVSIKVTVGGAARIDVAGLLHSLDHYPYACTEQTVSRALPLLYLHKVAHAAGLGEENAAREKVEAAIKRVLGNQSASGSFGLWNSYSAYDPWLDAYVADFLTRAREEGFMVPDRAFDMALTNLENRLAYAADFTEGGEEIAYGLYVLARNGRASMGDLRYYLDTKLDAFSTPLAKAQLAASLSLYGEAERSRKGFEAAVLALHARETQQYRQDYGSRLRDGAGVLSYISGGKADDGYLKDATDFVRMAQERRTFYSTQDMAWLLMAAHELNAQAEESRIAVDGQEHAGRLLWSFNAADFGATGRVVENRGDQTSNLLVSVVGQPLVPEPEGGLDYTIERQIFDLDGHAIEPDAVPVGKRLAVVVTVRALSERAGRLMVVDRLPAGLTIDNPRLLKSADVGALDWLRMIDQPEHAQVFADRFEVSIDEKDRREKEFNFVYLARAVTPGDYLHPPASVEDMYRPERRARTASGRFTVLGPVR